MDAEMNRLLKENEGQRQRVKALEFESRDQTNSAKQFKKQKETEFEQLRASLEQQRENAVNREVRELTVQFNGEKNALQHELGRAQDQNQLLSYENQNCKRTLSEQEVLIRSLKLVELRCIEGENQSANLARDLDRCKDEIDKRNQLIESLKDKQYETDVHASRQAKDL